MFEDIKIQMMILSEEQLISSTGKELLKREMWVRKSKPLMNSSEYSYLSNFIPHILMLCAEKDHHGLTQDKIINLLKN